jgi:hypothetical protein
MPRPQLLYAQIIKTTQHWRLVKVQRRMVFETLALVDQGLVAWGWQINTSRRAPDRVTLIIRRAQVHDLAL